MNDANESRKKERSPNFPFISLAAALDRAAQFYEQEKRGSAPFPVAAEHWHYSPSSSGAMQTGAALKSYGLMVDEGGGANRKLKLTELALRILLDQRPDSVEREQYKRQAAITPPVAAEIYEKWPDGLPSEATLNHYLVLELGFNQSTAVRAVRIITENDALTKSVVQDNQSAYNKTSEVVPFRESSVKEAAFQMIPGNPAPIVVPKTPISVRTERVIDPAGLDILLQFNGEPSLDSYEFLKDYIDLRIKALKRASSGPTDKDKQD